MIAALVWVVVVAAGALAAFGLVTTVRNQVPGRAMRLAVTAVVALLAAQAVIAAVLVFAGRDVPELSTFLIYLAVSVCVLPIGWQFATAEPSRWSGAVIAAAAIGTAVAVVRLQGLWNAGGGVGV